MNAPPKYVVIVGCGRLGAYLADALSRQGHSVVVIDRSEDTFRGLSSDFSGFRIVGDATESAVLQEAKTEDADVLIAATGEDNVNLMVCQVAQKVFGVRRAMARVSDPVREDIYRQLGLATVCPTLLAGDELLRMAANLGQAGDGRP